MFAHVCYAATPTAWNAWKDKSNKQIIDIDMGMIWHVKFIFWNNATQW